MNFLKSTFLFLALATSVGLSAQCGSITLNTQEQIDRFPIVTLECTTIVNLTIIGDDITNLDGLSSLTLVSDELYISGNDILTNINGLSNITSVQDFTLQNNPLLANLDGLSSLTFIGDKLEISNNAILANIDGLSGLTIIDGRDLVILDNPLLADLDGLSSLTSIGRDLEISNNAILANLDGLRNLTSIYGELSIHDNPLLANLDGLSSLSTTGEGDLLSIQGNVALDEVGDFCGLYTLLSSDFDGTYSASGNTANPTEEEITLLGAACPPVISSGVPTMGQWGLIVLSLMFFIFGVVMIRGRELSPA